MTNEQKRGTTISVVVLLIGFWIYWSTVRPEQSDYPKVIQINSPSATPSSVSPSTQPPPPHAFDGDGCTSDCSGHEAGYSWAEQHDIDDVDDCDTAGDSHNSPSFAEGCKDYVHENNADADDAASDPD